MTELLAPEKTKPPVPLESARPTPRLVDGSRRLTRFKRGIGQRAPGDELALRNENYTRHGEQQDKRHAKQRVDRAIDDAVLRQK